jgi:protoporphyrinogen/coproporphyrinogen III oxidase
MAALTDALHARVRTRVSLGASATALRRGGSPGAPTGWVLDAGGEATRCDSVVLTVPADVAADLLRGEAPEAADRVRRLRYNPILMVYLEGECGLHGLGYQVGFEEGLRTRGTTWNASALGRPGIHTAFLGGSRDPGVGDLADEEIGAIARREFLEVTGCATRVLGVQRSRIPAWDRSWEALDELRVPEGLHLCANWESRAGIPARVERARALARQLAGTGAPTLPGPPRGSRSSPPPAGER